MALRAPALNLMLERGENSRTQTLRHLSLNRTSRDVSRDASMSDISVDAGEDGGGCVVYNTSLPPTPKPLRRINLNNKTCNTFSPVPVESPIKLKISMTEKKENEEEGEIILLFLNPFCQNPNTGFFLLQALL